MISRQLTVRSWSYPKFRLQTHIPAAHMLHINAFGPARVNYYKNKLLMLGLILMMVSVFGFPPLAQSTISSSSPDLILSSPILSTLRHHLFIMNNAKSGSIEDQDAERLSHAMLYWGSVFNIPQEYLLGLGAQESHFEKYAISTSNAIGVFQIIPKFHLQDIESAQEATGQKNIFDMEIQAYLACKILDRYRSQSGGSLDKALLRYYGSDSYHKNKLYQKSVIKQRDRARSYLSSI